MLIVALTIDVEQDCPPYLNTFRGIEEGLPRLLDLFSEENINSTFFSTGDVARRYPESIKAIVKEGHELGCHGDSHQKFTDMNLQTAEDEIKNSTQTLRQFYPVTSFRAPNLMFPSEFLPLLEQAGYQLDSSQAKYKKSYFQKTPYPTTLTRIPASVTSSVLRLPKLIRFNWFKKIKNPIVLFVHPWEFVDLRNEKLRLDCRFKTGEQALDCLKENIRFFKNRGAKFHQMKDLKPYPKQPQQLPGTPGSEP